MADAQKSSLIVKDLVDKELSYLKCLQALVFVRIQLLLFH
jgi:hypothetical protein